MGSCLTRLLFPYQSLLCKKQLIRGLRLCSVRPKEVLETLLNDGSNVDECRKIRIDLIMGVNRRLTFLRCVLVSQAGKFRFLNEAEW